MATTTADATRHTLPDHHPIGISTGVFEAARGDWPALVNEACRVSTFAVELSALSGAELPGLVRYLLAKPRLPFRYVSVHAPVKHQGLEAPVLVQQLAELQIWVRSILAHPDALSDPDTRKGTGRTADEIEPFFEALPDAGFCLDVAHAWSIDPTMAAPRGKFPGAHWTIDRKVPASQMLALTPAPGPSRTPSPGPGSNSGTTTTGTATVTGTTTTGAATTTGTGTTTTGGASASH